MKNGKTIHGVRAAIFDLDGTLFDSTELWFKIDVDFLKKRGYQPTEEYRRALGALGNREAAHFTVSYYKLSDTPEQLMEEWAGMARHEYANSVKLFDGAREYLQDVHKRGIKIVAVTSLAKELVEAGLNSNGIYKYFDNIVTADETGLSKTSPDIYVYAAKAAGVSTEACVAFDDVQTALDSARKAGMKTVAVVGNGFHCSGDCADHVVETIAGAPVLELD